MTDFHGRVAYARSLRYSGLIPALQPPPGKMPARWLECGGLDAEFRRGVAGRQHQQAV